MNEKHIEDIIRIMVKQNFTLTTTMMMTMTKRVENIFQFILVAVIWAVLLCK